MKNHHSDKVYNHLRFGKHSCPSLSCWIKAFIITVDVRSHQLSVKFAS